MHEMSLAEGIRSIVTEAAGSAAAERVNVVVLEIGALAAVEVEALRFCLDVVLKDSVAEAARIEIEEVPGEGWCMQCAERVPIAARYDACPRCGSYQVQAVAGTEMRVKEIGIVSAGAAG